METAPGGFVNGSANHGGDHAVDSNVAMAQSTRVTRWKSGLWFLETTLLCEGLWGVLALVCVTGLNPRIKSLSGRSRPPVAH